MKLVNSVDGNQKHFYPKKVYCFRTIKEALEELLARPGFKETLHAGPTKSDSQFMFDTCDGKIYHDFKDDDLKEFFANKRNIGLMMNFDFFDPFENTEYSLGVIYCVITNLPRHLRFKWENVLVLGVIPGPSEPKLTINTFLEPIVDELIQFWKGKPINESKEDVCIYKAALVCLSSDIPATRKCGGFLGHNARKGIKVALFQNLSFDFLPC